MFIYVMKFLKHQITIHLNRWNFGCSSFKKGGQSRHDDFVKIVPDVFNDSRFTPCPGDAMMIVYTLALMC